MESSIRNVLPVLKFLQRRNESFEAIAKERRTVDTISFPDLFHYFLRVV